MPWACQALRLSAGAASPHYKRTLHASVLGTCVLADTSHGGLRSTARFVSFARTAPVGVCTAWLAFLANQQKTVFQTAHSIELQCNQLHIQDSCTRKWNLVGPALLGKRRTFSQTEPTRQVFHAMLTIVRTAGCIDESTAVLAIQDIPQLVNEVRQPRVEGTYSNTQASAFLRHTLLQTADGELACNSRAM